MLRCSFLIQVFFISQWCIENTRYITVTLTLRLPRNVTSSEQMQRGTALGWGLRVLPVPVWVSLGTRTLGGSELALCVSVWPVQGFLEQLTAMWTVRKLSTTVRFLAQVSFDWLSCSCCTPVQRGTNTNMTQDGVHFGLYRSKMAFSVKPKASSSVSLSGDDEHFIIKVFSPHSLHSHLLFIS